MNQKYKMRGIVKRISGVKQISEKFQTRNFILEAGSEKYPNPINFQLSGKYLDYVDDRMRGRKVEVEFYINGNANKKGYFNNLSAVSVMFPND